MITKIKKPNHSNLEGEERFERRSDGMAEIAREHHESLQLKDIDPSPAATSQREKAIDEALNALSVELNEDKKTRLEKDISSLEIQVALAASANGKAPGLDGIPYELWKLLMI
jgi:hypothetical protein